MNRRNRQWGHNRRESNYNSLDWAKIDRQPTVHLYAGDLPDDPRYAKFVGLSLTRQDPRHIRHDVTKQMPLGDSRVTTYYAEDVFEHIRFAALFKTMRDIYRVLKPSGVCRLALPDYRCDVLQRRTMKKNGRLVFDPGGGGTLVFGKVFGGGHVWFPTYELVEELVNSVPFSEVNFLHYYSSDGSATTHPIDYSLGHVQRTPDFDKRVATPYRPMSIVVDCVK